MGIFDRIGAGVKSMAAEIKGLPFSSYGGTGYGGAAYPLPISLTGNNYPSAIPGTSYDYRTAAGVLWQNPSAAACFVALTKAFAQASPMLEKRDGKNWARVESHPLIDLLNVPNPGYSGTDLFAVTLVSTMSCGSGFWRIERDRKGDPAEIWFEPPMGMGPTGMAPAWDKAHYIRDYFYFVDGQRVEEPIELEDAVYFRYGLNPANTREPWGPLGLGVREIATLNSASTYTGALMRNSAIPSGMISLEGSDLASSTPPSPEQAEEMKRRIKSGFKGDNVGEPFVSSLPWKWTPFNWSPSELTIDKLRQWPQGNVCALLGTPEIVALLPTGEQPTYQNLAASMQWWWDNTIIPLEDNFGSTIETQMFPAFDLDRNEYRISWDRSRVPALQEDENAKHTMVREDYKAGVIDLYEATMALGNEATDDMKGVRHPLATPKSDGDDDGDVSTADLRKQQQLEAVKALAEELKRFNPNQPRDDDGQWASGGSSEASSRSAVKGEMRAATAEDRKRLGVPPAYTDVLVTDDPKAELIATAKSGKGKLQYYYSAAYSSRQAAAKFDRVKQVHQALPAMRKTWDAEIESGGKNAHEAMALRLISQTGFRVGGLDGGGDTTAYGASSPLTSHVKVSGDRLDFDFIGKGGHQQVHSLKDAVLAEHVKARQAAGEETVFDTDDAKVRDYLKRAGGDFKVHDLRTRTASALAAHYVGTITKSAGVPKSAKEMTKAKNAIADKVAKKLGDTRSVVLSSYIAPQVWQSWEQ